MGDQPGGGTPVVVPHPVPGSPASHGDAATAVTRLRFATSPPDQAAAGELVVVLDTTWTPGAAERTPRLVSLRDVAERVLAERDLIAEATLALDAWAEASGVVPAMTIEGVSFWYGARLGHWLWVLDKLLWLGVVDAVCAAHPGLREIACDPGVDPGLALVVGLVAARDGLAFAGPEATSPSSRDTSPARAGAPAPTASSPAPGPSRSPIGRLRWRVAPPEPERRRRLVLRRLEAIEADPVRRLLVVQAHVRQRVETPAGPRHVNPYLGPVVDRLRGSRLEPFEVDLRASMTDDPDAWARLETRERARTLPLDARQVAGKAPGGSAAARDEARRITDRIAASGAPLPASGVDLGPALTTRVADKARSLGRRITEVASLRVLLRRLHPAGILLADEYHRQDWLAAAAAEQIPVAAIQHGVIYRWHTGYVHATRPPELRLPDRTYVFGSWEREVLTTGSVYGRDEVVVGGSPRLDLVEPRSDDRAALRARLGVADGDRMVVLSGTWGGLYRRFHYPIALAHLFDRPTERVHLVVKLHPSERDEGPYRRIVANLAAAGGFDAPPVSLVQDVDLYRLLAAADAHLGIHSTLLTEAVATATPNLLATGLQSADLLGYVDAGVAIPVREAADLRAALGRPRDEAMREDDRVAFLRRHFEPGSASERIAADLLAWLP